MYPSSHCASTSPKKVLVVDDNRPSAMTLTWAMETFGFEVRTCFDGASAVTVAQDFLPEIVLLDLGMPIMDGFEVCRRLRSDQLMARTSIVAQTGWGDADTRRRTNEAGFDYHLTKPVDFDALRKFIDSETRSQH